MVWYCCWFRARADKNEHRFTRASYSKVGLSYYHRVQALKNANARKRKYGKVKYHWKLEEVIFVDERATASSSDGENVNWSTWTDRFQLSAFAFPRYETEFSSDAGV